MPANVGEMFYYGDIPWHGLGTKLLQPANAFEAMHAGCLNWEVDLIPLETVENPPSPVFRRMAVVRKDRRAGDKGRVLGVVHPDFSPLQNSQGMEIMEALLGKNQRVYQTGGYLGKGEVVWLLARLPRSIQAGPDDPVEPYLLFTNSHDGTSAIDFRLTATRVVCQNTLILALRDWSSAIFKRSHHGAYADLEAEAKRFFSMLLKATSELEQQFKAFGAIPFPPDRFKVYTDDLVPLPKPPTRSRQGTLAWNLYEVRLKKAREIRAGIIKVHESGIENQKTIPPAEHNLWGALNAVTAFVDHAQATGKVDRYVHAMFGTGAELKRSAYRLALDYLPSAPARTSLLN